MTESGKSNNGRLRVLKNPQTDSDAAANDSTPPKSRGIETCPRCFGTGMEIIPGEGARRCDCDTPQSVQRLIRAARIPVRYKECRLENFKHGDGDDSNYWVHKAAETYVAEYPGVRGGILFMGPAGVGKTHLAVAILQELIITKGVPGLFYQFGALLKEIQASFNPVSQMSELDVLQPVFDAEVLVLDDLGASKTTDWVRDTMMQIINTRYNDQRITIFTTNYLDKPLKHQPETLEERIGVTLRSRLYEMCSAVLMSSDDYRQTHLKQHFF